MQVGTDPGPGGPPQHQSCHYVYVVPSGVIVGTYHFIGSSSRSEEARLEEMLKTSHEASGIPREELAVLSNPELPPGQGELYVDHATLQLVRKQEGFDPRVRP